jgi:hypothetical protein
MLHMPLIWHVPHMLLVPHTLSVPCMVRVTFCYETNKLINSVCNKQELPEQWKESIIVPVYEMGNKTKTVEIIEAYHFSCQG